MYKGIQYNKYCFPYKYLYIKSYKNPYQIYTL